MHTICFSILIHVYDIFFFFLFLMTFFPCRSHFFSSFLTHFATGNALYNSLNMDCFKCSSKQWSILSHRWDQNHFSDIPSSSSLSSCIIGIDILHRAAFNDKCYIIIIHQLEMAHSVKILFNYTKQTDWFTQLKFEPFSAWKFRKWMRTNEMKRNGITL